MESRLNDLIMEYVGKGGMEALNEVVATARAAAGMDSPVAAVRWVPLEKVRANDYNPNQVAKNELRLLKVSIEADGFTQPVVTVFDAEQDEYVIVDGFHRHLVMKTYASIREAHHGYLPIVVIDRPIKDRMASTVRHNRARGKHSVNGMGHLVGQLREKGWDTARICNELGLEPDEMVRLEHVTGVAELFKDREFSRAWEDSLSIIRRNARGEKR